MPWTKDQKEDIKNLFAKHEEASTERATILAHQEHFGTALAAQEAHCGEMTSAIRATIYGTNGTPGLKTKVHDNTRTIMSLRKVGMIIIGAIVTALVGIAATWLK